MKKFFVKLGLYILSGFLAIIGCNVSFGTFLWCAYVVMMTDRTGNPLWLSLFGLVALFGFVAYKLFKGAYELYDNAKYYGYNFELYIASYVERIKNALDESDEYRRKSE